MLTTGAGTFVDDVSIAGAAYACFVRSPHAHARIKKVDVSAAASVAGCLGVATAPSLALPPMLEIDMVPAAFSRPPLASDVVRFVGEAVAVVVGASREIAVDLAGLVEIEYEPLEAVIDPEAALSVGAPLLFPSAGTNLAYQVTLGDEGDVLSDAEVVVSGRFLNQRLAPVPMEPGAIAAVPQPDGSLRIWASTQVPFDLRAAIATGLGWEAARVRVVVPNVGGGFGAKGYVYPEQVVVAAMAARLGIPIKYVETRSENMVAMGHGRGQVQDVQLGATREGRLVGLKVSVISDAGAYPGLGAFLPTFTGVMASGVYRIGKIAFTASSVATNTTPITAYRGAGRPEATALIERAMDMLAANLGQDPAALRRFNLIAKEDMPYRTRSNAVYDSGDYRAALEVALEAVGYEELRVEQARRRSAGSAPLLGIGLGVYVEMTGGKPPASEWASVEVNADESVRVLAGTMDTGQGHRTAFAQLVSEMLEVPLDRVEVLEGDTGQVARGIGTYASRSLQLGGTAIHKACVAVRERARTLAAQQMEVDPADLRLIRGGFQVVGVPGTGISWHELAIAAADVKQLPPGVAPGLKAEAEFDQAGASTYPYGAHVAVVEVDPETGLIDLKRLVAVDDCGTILNPLLVEGQVHGGLAQGIGQALFEGVVYDPAGTPMTATMLDYLLPTITELPAFELHHTAVPTPLNPLGAKGVGESGTIGSAPAVQNAVIDAVSHLGVTHLDMPITPQTLWKVLQATAVNANGDDVNAL